MSATVLVVCDDLLFWSKIEGAARAAGVPARRARGGDDVTASIATGGVFRLLVDLSTRSIDPFAGAPAWKGAAPGTELIAFGSHVDADAQAKARAAGFDRVLARSAFVRELPSLVRRPPEGPGPPGSSHA